ncbi:glycosyltransferase [Devosia sp. 919]|uniref:glycosyltransferase n=1 Tax=Devosia sp. 919 TaxID=2726065 RepID=UPI001555813F|nr:glycosyltransferase [Devosia sp. 919]
MIITVVMCTRNRAEQLRLVLDSAVALRVPESLAWEFVLVDNGSTDHTAEVAASYVDRLPLRCVREHNPGLSNARNRGVAEAKGDYICWTDDDVIIDPNWVAAYAEAFIRHPEAAFFGGVIEPVLEGETPNWFKENPVTLSHLLAERDFGEVVLPLSPSEQRMPYGANYAVRTKEQRTHPYDPSLGVGPGMKRLGEETDVLHSIFDEGGAGFWVPGARVRHIIPESRQTEEYVRTYHRSAGDTWAHLGGRYSRSEPEVLVGGKVLFGAPVWIWRKTFTHTLLYIGTRLVAPSNVWLHHSSKAAFYSGALGYLRRSKNS